MVTRSILRPVLRPVTRAVSDTIRGFNPRSLFASGEQGIWLDPSDFSTLFQDSAGTTPVTAVGQPVGKILDKSGRGNHASQTTSASRPTLQQDSNGLYYLSFDGTDDWMTAGAASTFNFLHNNLGATVFCGYMPSGASVYHTILATGNLGSAGVVGFTLSQDDRTVGVTNNIIANGSGSLFVNSNPTTGVTASKRVVSVVNASGNHITRKNAVQIRAATETGSASLANSTYVLNIGRTGAGLSPLNGRIYQLIVRGAESNAGQIAAGEAWCNSKTRAY